MQEPRDKSIMPSAAPPAGYSQAAPPSVQSTLQLPPPRQNVLSTLARVLLRRLLYVLIMTGRIIKPHLAWVLVVAFLVGIIGFEGLLLILPRLSRGTPGDGRVAALAPSESVVNFLQGQAKYDADMMWNAFSPELQSSLEKQGVEQATLAAQAESERMAGQRYIKYEYVGGVRLANSEKMYFYVVDIESPTPERNGTFSFIFTVNRAGKIISVRM